MGIFGSSYSSGNAQADDAIGGIATGIFSSALQKIGLSSGVPASPTQIASVQSTNYAGAGAQAPQAINGSGADVTTAWYKKPIVIIIAIAVILGGVLISRR